MSDAEVIQLHDPEIDAVTYGRTSQEDGDPASQSLNADQWSGDDGRLRIVEHQEDRLPGDTPPEMRPGLQRALRLIESGAVNAIVFSSWSRIARDVGVQEEIFQRIWRASGRAFIIGFGEVLQDEPGCHERAMIRRMFARAAEEELEFLRRRRVLGRRRKAARQGYIGGNPWFGEYDPATSRPYGREFVRINGKLEYRPVEHEQQQIRRMCAWRNEGLSYGQIADRLNDEGLRTVTGVRWHRVQVRRLILRGPIRPVPVPPAVKPHRPVTDARSPRYVSGRSA